VGGEKARLAQTHCTKCAREGEPVEACPCASIGVCQCAGECTCPTCAGKAREAESRL
jgi:hypothetical protein